jgi:hypothetical protein
MITPTTASIHPPSPFLLVHLGLLGRGWTVYSLIQARHLLLDLSSGRGRVRVDGERQAEIPPARRIMFRMGVSATSRSRARICSATASTWRHTKVACRLTQAPNHATFEKASEFFNSLLEQQTCRLLDHPDCAQHRLRRSLKPYARALGVTSSATEPSR